MRVDRIHRVWSRTQDVVRWFWIVVALFVCVLVLCFCAYLIAWTLADDGHPHLAFAFLGILLALILTVLVLLARPRRAQHTHSHPTGGES